ncbi:MAG: hypothetical protein ACOYXT_09680 [Bacteroidota bacterium]
MISLTVIGVYFFGLGDHHTFFQNSVISTTILSIAFFLFITTGLYRGIRLKHEAKRVAKGNNAQVPDGFDLLHHVNIGDSPDLDLGDGIVGIIVGIFVWILFAVLLSILLWIFSNLVAAMIVLFSGMLYWIFFRALRLVFKNSNKTKGNLIESIKYGLVYTLLYNSWIYGIFILTAYLKKS